MMDNGTQGQYSTSISNSVESRTSNMYILQVKPSSSEGSLQTDAIPLHMLINGQDPQHHEYFIPVIQGKQLQLFIDSREQADTNTANNQYYSIVTEPQTDNNELQILNSDITVTPSHEHILQIKTDAKCRMDKLSSNEDKINNTKASHNIEQKKKVLQKFVHISDRLAPPRAVAVLPGALTLRRGAVWPRAVLPARVRFGPVQGIKRSLTAEEAESLKLAHSDSGLPLFMLKTEDDTHTHIDVSDMDKSNWLSLLPLGDQSTANVWLYEEDHELYAATINTIPARVPLVLGYSKEYVDAHKLPVEQPVLDLEAELTAKHRQWWCHECQRSMSTAALLQRHMDVYHTEEKQRPRRYRCLHCTRSFCRLFTLRRHTARHCKENAKKAKEDKNNELQGGQTANGLLDTSKPDDLPDLPITPADDSRLPSDESLQTLTNNLDFSTTLFDTERINLDISGSSREDFNYSLGLKDDIALAAGIDFGIDESCSKKEVSAVFDLSITLAEDSRLPSDESLQTLTNNLDFSTTLFDTERINLDISGSSREDFNYSLGLKNDIALAAGIDFGIDDSCSKKEVRRENTETVFLTCRYCNQAVIRGRQRQHVKACTERKYHCECGRAFLYKDKLALHIHIDHPNLTSDQRRQNSKEDDLQYKCETCNHKFKRRGMLVNHLWRVHKTLSTAVPLEKKVRHYPCVTCPKVYRTAAKRDSHVKIHHPVFMVNRLWRVHKTVSTAVPLEKKVRHCPCVTCPKVYRPAAKRDSHVKIHHPGLSVSGIGTSIEGGLVSCAPAACSACPRQYATRAKLLQHVRRHHPALVHHPILYKGRARVVRAGRVLRVPAPVRHARQAAAARAATPSRAGTSIEGGLVSCAPAACSACPHQYATRAKLLQHVRRHHPALVHHPILYTSPIQHHHHYLKHRNVDRGRARVVRAGRVQRVPAPVRHARQAAAARAATPSRAGTSIEGGLVSCAPAACSACPRQYATRAKLLQHVRRHHPALVHHPILYTSPIQHHHHYLKHRNVDRGRARVVRAGRVQRVPAPVRHARQAAAARAATPSRAGTPPYTIYKSHSISPPLPET
ncbi:uncharacterized protein LOC134650162 [Cydia amplana]|uniref:uncharacterized protein LOC134650162 n=1 Tax=Cydia amplana TaxID=1869771 RepID=UPI002FE67550